MFDWKKTNDIAWGGLFEIDGLPVDLTPYTIRCAVKNGDFTEAVTVTKHADQTGHRGEFTISHSRAAMADWPLGVFTCDILYELSGLADSTEDFQFRLVPGVTT